MKGEVNVGQKQLRRENEEIERQAPAVIQEHAKNEVEN